MIRPVLYVDLPGILFALDGRARSLGRPFATFICAPDYEETHSGLGAVIQNLLPIRPMTRTWIAEEHWRLQGVAQARMRPRTSSWDLVYLATLAYNEANPSDVLVELMEETLNAAIRNGMQHVFARSNEDDATLALFQRMGFQCYARELLYTRPTPVITEPEVVVPLGGSQTQMHRWGRIDAWNFARLHDATTPRKVLMAESLGSDELAHQFVPRMRSWWVPGVEPRDESYVVEVHARFSAWVRIRQGWAGVPHQLWLKVHPEHTAIADEVLRFALQRLSQRGILPGGVHLTTPVICHIRDYDGPAIDALRRADFEHVDTKAILVRQLALRAFNERMVQSLEQTRINYGVKGLSTVQSAPLRSTREALHASDDH